MPFVAIVDVQDLIPAGLKSHFKSNPDVFEQIEAEAGKIITRITGVASPADIADRPDWAVVHMANIMTYLTVHLLASLSTELMDLIKQKYSESIKFLEGLTTRGPVTEIEYSSTGTFSGVLTW